MSSKVVDLTELSDDGSSVHDSPERKRWRMSADLLNAPSKLSNSRSGVASLGSRQVSLSAVSFNTSSATTEDIPRRRNDFASSSVAAAAASRHSNDDESDDDDDDSIALAIPLRRNGSSVRDVQDSDVGSGGEDTPSPLSLISRAMTAVRSAVNGLLGSRRVARIHPDAGNAQPCTVGGCGCNRPHPTHFRWTNTRLTSTTDVSALPNILFHQCDPFYQLKKYAASMMRREEGYDTTHGRSLVEALISVLAQAKSTTSYITAAILKCSTARLGHSIGNFGTSDVGANLMEIPSHHSSVVLNRVFSSNGIAYPNGQSFLGINARTKCRTKPNGIHCEDWTPEEVEFAVRVLKWFILILWQMQIPLLFINLGGAGCVRIIDGLNTLLFMMCQEATDEDQRLLRRNVQVIGGGTHFSNYVCWRFKYEDAMQQILRVSKSVFATDQALKAWFELVIIPRCNALGLPVPPLPELFRQLVADDMTVFVQNIYSPNALANELAWNAAVRRIHGSFSRLRQIARRDAGDLSHHLTTLAHRQIVSDSHNRRVADGSHQFLHKNGYVNPTLDFEDYDAKLLAYINFKDGKYDAQPLAGTRHTFEFGECDLNQWKRNQLRASETRVHPGWIPRIAALRAVLELKPHNPRGKPSLVERRPIWNASRYAHITSRIRNGYQED